MHAAPTNKPRRFKPKTKEALLRAIERAMKASGPECDLNHLDVSGITDFEDLFLRSIFNGNISGWDVSNATTMHGMFQESAFNGDVSKWDVSRVTTMKQMFGLSQFNGDVSGWDVSSVRDFKQIFYKAPFEGSIARWAIHPEAYIGTMYGLDQTRTSDQASLFHWQLAAVNPDHVSPELRSFYKKHEQLVKSIVSDPVERAYWIHDLWCQAQVRGDAPQESYAVGTELFESESGP